MGDVSFTALASIDAGVLILDGDGIIVRANPRATQILKVSEVEIASKPIGEVLAPLAKLLGYEGRFEVVVPGDRQLVVGGRMSSFDHEAHQGHVCLFQDLTEIRQIAEERDRMRQFAALTAAIPSMLHELRNPLATMGTMVDVILSGFERGRSTDDLAEDLAAVRSEIRRMALTLQGIGGIGRSLRTNRATEQGAAISGVLRNIRPTAELAGVALTVEIATLPPMPLDTAVVGAVIFNLVYNAILACSRGDSIAFEAVIAADGGLKLCVADTGCGMSPETLERARDLFYTTRRSGSGVGLHLCERATRSVGGRLQIESIEGEGTTITAHIPLLLPERRRRKSGA